MKCPKCGGELERKEEGKYVCPNCNSKFAVKSAAKPSNTQAEPRDIESSKNTVESGDSSKEQISQYANDNYFEQNSFQNHSGPNYYQSSTDSYDQNPYPYAPYAAPYAQVENPPAPAANIPNAADIRASARTLVKKNFGYCVLTEILLRLVQIGSLIPLLIFGPLLTGGAVQSSYAGFYVDVANDRCEGSRSTYRGFNNFMPALWLNLLCTLLKLLPIIVIVVDLGSCLRSAFRGTSVSIMIIIVTVIVTIGMLFLLAYLSSITQFAFFGLNSDVSAKPTELLNHAAKMVDKNFGKILALKLSFIGWWLLCYLTCGVLLVYVVPYYKTSLTKQYLAFVAAKDQTPVPAQPQAPTAA